jgi:predicted dehydrogenase
MTAFNPPGVGIIGCGLIGRKRAAALGPARLVACADPAEDRARELARSAPGCRAFADPADLLRLPEVGLVIVSTTNHKLAELSEAALAAGKHVLIEKPAGRSLAELLPLEALARKARRLVRVGFNHRYHPAFLKARELVDSGAIGPLMFVRGRYGHGGRLGYEKEWRADPALSGGGELIDQGVHLIDLARWFLGDLAVAGGYAGTYFWDMPVDDNAFLLLQTPERRTAFLHVSCTEWKNLFCFEIAGRTGKLQVDGLGGSYGVERLTFYKMLPEMGPPDTLMWEYPRGDRSWALEFQDFLDDIRLGREPAAGLPAAAAAMRVVEQVYALSQEEPEHA